MDLANTWHSGFLDTCLPTPANTKIPNTNVTKKPYIAVPACLSNRMASLIPDKNSYSIPVLRISLSTVLHPRGKQISCVRDIFLIDFILTLVWVRSGYNLWQARLGKSRTRPEFFGPYFNNKHTNAAKQTKLSEAYLAYCQLHTRQQ